MPYEFGAVFFVPEGLVKIAQQFTAGLRMYQNCKVLEGRLNCRQQIKLPLQPSLQDLRIRHVRIPAINRWAIVTSPSGTNHPLRSRPQISYRIQPVEIRNTKYETNSKHKCQKTTYPKGF